MPMPFVPAELMDRFVKALHALNNDESIECLIVAVKDGEPPVLVSTLHPTEVPHILKFLHDFHQNATVVIAGTDTVIDEDSSSQEIH